MKNCKILASSLLAVILTSNIAYADGYIGMDLPDIGNGVKYGDPEIFKPKPIPENIEDNDDPRDTPPPSIWGEEIDLESDNICLVLDDSGSMAGRRMEMLHNEVTKLINGLSENMKFNIVSYSCAIRFLWSDLRQATIDNKAESISWLSTLVGGGGTGTGPATSAALNAFKECKNFVLITDGVPTCGAYSLVNIINNRLVFSNSWDMISNAHAEMIKKSNTQSATIDVFGINVSYRGRAFCMKVAFQSGGSYIDVPD